MKTKDVADKLALKKSKSRPGKMEADLAGVVISEGTARELERRAALAGMDVRVLLERMIVLASMTVPDDPDAWDVFVEACTHARLGRVFRAAALFPNWGPGG